MPASELFSPLLEKKSQNLIQDALKEANDGELFAENKTTESLYFDDGVLKDSSFHETAGMGLRALYGPCSLYTHTNDLSCQGLNACSSLLSTLPKDAAHSLPAEPAPDHATCFPELNQTDQTFVKKIAALQEMDRFARDLDPKVVQASFSFKAIRQKVLILRPQDNLAHEEERLYSTFVTVLVAEENGRRETGYVSLGTRLHRGASFFERKTWEKSIREAFRKCLVSLKAVPAPAGSMPVLLGNGITGILLHEAVGHGFEADFNRKGSSVFSNKMGKKVAHDTVTVIDEGRWDLDLAHGHGCLVRDDEGTLTQKTPLITGGIMTGHMSDRMNARLMGKTSSGNGRRQSYQHLPMPRMTNTYMQPGNEDFDAMARDIKNGIYAVGFSGGQVDIVSGQFVFAASEAYQVQQGKICAPIKGATLIGNGPQVMQNIVGVSNDLTLDPGMGYCGKDGQTVIVGLGQPSCLISELTVGGTQAA